MLQRQSPFFRDLNDLFESKWVPFATPAHTPFPMDIIERDDDFEVRIAVPGAKKENLSVTLDKGSLHINVSGGERDEKENYLLKGLKAFDYQRIIPNIIDYNVKVSEISSIYKDGILSITLPKEDEEKPLLIDVEIVS
tara:strand:- start:1861 stop:2274 length:414 start_codon:yes stop_codon:yes gene_type:complete